MRTYIAYVYKDHHSSFGVSFPDLPGCYGAGDSYEEALANAKISLREYAEAMSDDGKDMPKPSSHDDLASNASEAIEMDIAAFVAEVPLITVGSKRRVNISIDDRLLSAIDKACSILGSNRSAFLADIAAGWMENNLSAVVTKKKLKNRKIRNSAVTA